MKKQSLKFTLLGIVMILTTTAIAWWLVLIPGRSTSFVSNLPLRTPADWTRLHGTPEVMSFLDQSLTALRVPRVDVPQESGTQIDEALREWNYYVYDGEARGLQTADASSWDRSRGKLSRCYFRGEPQTRLPADFTRDAITTEKFGVANSEPVAAQLIGMTLSPTRTRSSVISANRIGGMTIPFLGSENGSTGQHFHQMLDLNTRDWIGEPVGLPFTTRRADFEPVHLYTCWSADERWVVYVHDEGVVFVPVPVDPESPMSKEP